MLAFIEDGRASFVSRDGRTFRQFAVLADFLAHQLPVGMCDGEIVVLDREGRPQSTRVLARRSVFDVLRLLTNSCTAVLSSAPDGHADPCADGL